MLSITSIDNYGEKNIRDWELGKMLPYSPYNEDIVLLFATGEELKYISELFPAIVPQNVKTAHITKPFAELIFKNIED